MNNEKYVHISKNITFYHYPGDQYVAVIIKSANQDIKRSIKDVKPDAIKILQLIDGERCLAELIEYVQKMYNVSENSVINFIEDSVKIGILYLDNNKEKYEMKIIGDGKLALPRHATLEITELCNLKCIYCYNEASPAKGKHMPLMDIINIFKILSENGVTVLEISGGEPMIHPNIREILEAAFKYFNWVAVISNGVFFPRDIMPILQKNRKKFGGIQISIDGSDEITNAKMRQVKNTFGKTLDTINYLKKNGFLVRVVIVLTEDNIGDIENTCELMREMGVKHFGISISEEWGRGKAIEKTESRTDKSYRNYFKDKYGELLKSVNEKYHDIIFNDKVMKNVNLSEIRNCGAGWQTIAITPNGDIEICAPGKIILGNIFAEDYKKIFSSTLVRKLQKVDFKEDRENICLLCSDVADCAMCFSKIFSINEKRVKSGRGVCSVVTKYGLEEFMQ